MIFHQDGKIIGTKAEPPRRFAGRGVLDQKESLFIDAKVTGLVPKLSQAGNRVAVLC
jgi:hypothetical protein